MMDMDNIKEMMMAALDGELDEQGLRELERRLAEDEGLRREFERMKRLSEFTAGMELAEPEEEVWRMYWTGVYNRMERGAGWILLSVGAIIMLAFGAFYYVRDFLLSPAEPLGLRLGLSAAILGAIILFVSVLRERLFIRKKERYEEIMR